MNREERRILQRLLKSPTGLTRQDLHRPLISVMTARLFDHTLMHLICTGYVRINRARRLTATEPEDARSRLQPRPTIVVYVPAPTPAPQRDILREIATGPYNPNDPRRRGLFSLSR
jgi:hypothetical protein